MDLTPGDWQGLRNSPVYKPIELFSLTLVIVAERACRVIHEAAIKKAISFSMPKTPTTKYKKMGSPDCLVFKPGTFRGACDPGKKGCGHKFWDRNTSCTAVGRCFQAVLEGMARHWNKAENHQFTPLRLQHFLSPSPTCDSGTCRVPILQLGILESSGTSRRSQNDVERHWRLSRTECLCFTAGYSQWRIVIDLSPLNFFVVLSKF